MSAATETKNNTWRFSQHTEHQKKANVWTGQLSERHYTVGQDVLWRHDDGEVVNGKVTRVDLLDYPQILVQWEDSVSPVGYSSKDKNRAEYFDKVEMKDMWISAEYGIIPVTEVEYEEIKD